MKYDIEEINGKYIKVPYEKRYNIADYNNATYVIERRITYYE